MDGRKFSVIEAGGKVLSLRLSFNAMVEFNSEVGSIDAAFRNQPFKAFRSLILHSANEANPGSLTLRGAGDFCEDYISENGMEALGDKVRQLMDDSGWLKSNAEEEPGKNGNPAPKRPSKK
jgi:hypothetical protein